RARGRYIAITQLVGFTAIPLAAYLSMVLVPTHQVLEGWRCVMIIGAAGAFFVWYLRRALPESPRWAESRGRCAEGERIMIAIGGVLTVFTYWFSAVLHAYQAELFPTRARATGVGFTYSWSRLSAVFSTLIIGALLREGVLAVFMLMAAAMVGVALVVGIFGPTTNAVVLEEISR